MKSPTTTQSSRSWDAGASLRTSARRLENAERVLATQIADAYADGMPVRAIGRHVGRSHRWVIDQLRTAGIYEARKEA